MEDSFSKMKRIELFEFEDFDWFPSWLRVCMTNLIVILQRMMGVPKAVASLISEILLKHNIRKIVDMGSGSGGAMPEIMTELRKKEGLEKVELVMTDLFPSKEMIKKYSKYTNGINYLETPVDATNLANTPAGLKTMMNSFHHMPPKKAMGILQSAQENKQPLFIYELGENNIPVIIWALLLPISLAILIIMVLFMTPFVKPLTWRQIIFTYFIPIIPILYAWDGQASLMRMYAMKDVDMLLEGLGNETYAWKKGYVKKEKDKKTGTFILGMPI